VSSRLAAQLTGQVTSEAGEHAAWCDLVEILRILRSTVRLCPGCLQLAVTCRDIVVVCASAEV
jgi:hypothetical protein